jgi:hypothetical protein
MTTTIQSLVKQGSLLIEEGTAIPHSLRLEAAPYPAVWMSPASKLTSRQFETELSTGGWSFFYVAGTARTTAFGFDRDKTIHTALGRLTANAALKNCNCIEIDEVAGHSFFGIPWVSVSAHSRRIQKGQLFQK